MSLVEVSLAHPLPAIPDPTAATVGALQDACLAVRVWADDCNDIAAAAEALARVSAVETYLARKNADAPAQEAARWLEVRIGELLGPNPGSGRQDRASESLVSESGLSANERLHFRRLAEHRDLVASMVPCSRNAILKAIKRAEAAVKAPPIDLPADDRPTPTEFAAIVIDPPWRYDNVATRGAAEDHYPTMTQGDLLDLNLPAAENAHLYLWVTNSFFEDGFDLMRAWGFTYKTCLTWCKPQIGMGNYFRSTTEHVLFGIKGRLPTLRNDVPTHFIADRTRHSAKPESFYDLVETCSPGPWLEMFARRQRLGDWHVMGNETSGDVWGSA